jgi:hypothetical protein
VGSGSSSNEFQLGASMPLIVPQVYDGLFQVVVIASTLRDAVAR